MSKTKCKTHTCHDGKSVKWDKTNVGPSVYFWRTFTWVSTTSPFFATSLFISVYVNTFSLNTSLHHSPLCPSNPLIFKQCIFTSSVNLFTIPILNFLAFSHNMQICLSLLWTGKNRRKVKKCTKELITTLTSYFVACKYLNRLHVFTVSLFPLVSLLAYFLPSSLGFSCYLSA